MVLTPCHVGITYHVTRLQVDMSRVLLQSEVLGGEYGSNTMSCGYNISCYKTTGRYVKGTTAIRSTWRRV